MNGLFDFTFNKLITRSVVRILYPVLLGVNALGLLVGVIAAFVSNPLVGVVALLVAPVVLAINMIMLRVVFEFYVVVFSMHEQLGHLGRQAAAGYGRSTAEIPPGQYTGERYPDAGGQLAVPGPGQRQDGWQDAQGPDMHTYANPAETAPSGSHGVPDQAASWQHADSARQEAQHFGYQAPQETDGQASWGNNEVPPQPWETEQPSQYDHPEPAGTHQGTHNGSNLGQHDLPAQQHGWTVVASAGSSDNSSGPQVGPELGQQSAARPPGMHQTSYDGDDPGQHNAPAQQQAQRQEWQPAANTPPTRNDSGPQGNPNQQFHPATGRPVNSVPPQPAQPNPAHAPGSLGQQPSWPPAAGTGLPHSGTERQADPEQGKQGFGGLENETAAALAKLARRHEEAVPLEQRFGNHHPDVGHDVGGTLPQAGPSVPGSGDQARLPGYGQPGHTRAGTPPPGYGQPSYDGGYAQQDANPAGPARETHGAPGGAPAAQWRGQNADAAPQRPGEQPQEEPDAWLRELGDGRR